TAKLKAPGGRKSYRSGKRGGSIQAGCAAIASPRGVDLAGHWGHSPNMQLPAPPLLVVTDRRQARRPLTRIVAAALEAGCRWVSLREKDLPRDEQVLLARALSRMAHAVGATLT